MNPTAEEPLPPLPDYVDCELVIGLVGAVGTELTRVRDLLEKQLKLAGYVVNHVKISADIIPIFGKEIPEENDGPFNRISMLMDAGNQAREMSQENSVLALGAAAMLAAKRDNNGPSGRTATIIDSLKRPEEVERLREIYPGGFFLFGVHAEEAYRCDALQSMGMTEAEAITLIARDANEHLVESGQRVQMTFYLSDFFVRLDGNDNRLKGDLKRLVELLFGNPFLTPSFDEYAMFFAFAAALRSADLSRQVGAVITLEDQILATGANDCPKAGGGLYWPSQDEEGKWHDQDKGRDYVRGIDSNDKHKSTIIDEIVVQGKERGLDETTLKQVLASSPINDLTEFGRVVHAEMAAITSCARSNLSTKSATLYCTTFPCHNCAKHIVAAGISRVVYVEPYEKSKAQEFHNDSIEFGSEVSQDTNKTKFEPFVGVGPRKFFDLFSMKLSSGYPIVRKNKNTGEAVSWDPKTARLRIQMMPSDYLSLEKQAAEWFAKAQKGEAKDGELDKAE